MLRLLVVFVPVLWVGCTPRPAPFADHPLDDAAFRLSRSTARLHDKLVATRAGDPTELDLDVTQSSAFVLHLLAERTFSDLVQNGPGERGRVEDLESGSQSFIDGLFCFDAEVRSVGFVQRRAGELQLEEDGVLSGTFEVRTAWDDPSLASSIDLVATYTDIEVVDCAPPTTGRVEIVWERLGADGTETGGVLDLEFFSCEEAAARVSSR